MQSLTFASALGLERTSGPNSRSRQNEIVIGGKRARVRVDWMVIFRQRFSRGGTFQFPRQTRGRYL